MARTPSSTASPRRRWARRILMLLTGLAAFTGALFWLYAVLTVGGGKPDSFLAASLKSQVYRSIPPEEEQDFTRMDPADPGGWLTAFREFPQTLEIYKACFPLRPTPERRTIVLQPLGSLGPAGAATLEALREFSEAFFQLPARVERPLDLGEAKGWTRPGSMGRRQYNAARILSRVLAPRVPRDAMVYLGITMEDLWSDGLGFVFGVGSYHARVGVYSLCRYSPEFCGRRRRPGDETRALVRACKVLSHETGHCLGLSHCVFYHCCMNGANSMSEADSQSLYYCPLCDRKLWWNIGFDPVKRFRDLHAFYLAHGMRQEADWTAGRMAHCEQSAPHRGG